MQEEVTPDKFKLPFNTVINRLKKKKKKEKTSLDLSETSGDCVSFSRSGTGERQSTESQHE